jgi:sortase A
MKITLRRFNNGLSVLVMALCLYVIVAPLLPQATYTLAPKPPLVAAEEKGEKPTIPDNNTLVIPRIKLEQQIHENAVADWGLAKGVWRDPTTSSPDLSSNTVFSGHRFTYAGKSVFYHLDKVKSGDKIIVYWNKVRYEYTVKTIKEVPPTETEILKPTEKAALTLYTCTPLVTAENRLVIIAELNQGESQ